MREKHDEAPAPAMSAAPVCNGGVLLHDSDMRQIATILRQNVSGRGFLCGLAALPAFLFSGCATPTSVDYDRAAAARFADYACFALQSRESRVENGGVVLSPIVDRRIERALRSELRAKGFTDDCASPDFRVAFRTMTERKTQVRDFGVGPTPFRHHPYFGYYGHPRIDIDQYEEGTFVVDITDAETGELVWRGAYAKRIGWSAPSEAEVRRIVAAILRNFPPETAAERD